jgi:hypothetical protein
MNQITISFDFDDTLAITVYSEFCSDRDMEDILEPIPHIIDRLMEYYALGCKCIILTARRESFVSRKQIEKFLKDNNIYHCINKIVFSNLNLKGEYAKKEGVHLHYDDDPSHLEDLPKYGIKVVDSRL